VSPEKGILYLITAFHQVLKRFPDAAYIVGATSSAQPPDRIGRRQQTTESACGSVNDAIALALARRNSLVVSSGGVPLQGS
jgi:hypothetical protein